MDNDYFLVQWIHDNPVHSTIKQRCDITDDKIRQKSVVTLIDAEVKFKGGKTGRIIESGSKLVLQEGLKQSKSNVKKVLNQRNVGAGTKKKGSKNERLTRDKRNLDEVLNAVDSQEDHDELKRCKIEMEAQSKEIATLRERNEHLEEENTLMKTSLQNSSDTVDIGNGILLKQEFLTTIKATSGSPNIFARSLFKKLFDQSEVIGYSLMGNGCNANAGDKLPSIDARRRDAIIEYTLKLYLEVPGSRSFINAQTALKRSLWSLILEYTRDAKAAEAMLNGIDLNDNN